MGSANFTFSYQATANGSCRRQLSLFEVPPQPRFLHVSLDNKHPDTPTPDHQPIAIMSAGEEDLIDYSDEELQPTDGAATGAAAAAAPAANGDAKKGDLTVTGAGADKGKGSYVGIHSTSFRDFLLKPELLKAITDCGFEHPSEG